MRSALLVALVCFGCDDPAQSTPPDAEVVDAAPADAQAADAAAPDAEPPDAAPLGPYEGPEDWVCHPDKDDDPCDADLSATVVLADGTAEAEPFVRADAPTADCFYVYPTVSLDPAPNADLPVGDEETYITVAQAARFGAVCEVYAPGYRQVTIGGLAGAGDAALAHADVVAAFEAFAARDPARPFLLIGHSQGGFRLIQLLAERIETDDALHARLVAAYLIGANVAIPQDADVGGSFRRTPACRAADQTGCVVSYAAYRESDPPTERSLFAHVPVGRALCNHPGALAGGAAFLRPYFDPDLPAGLAQLFAPFEGPYTDAAANDAITTRFWSVPDLVEAECVTDPPFSYLRIRVAADPDDPRVDDVGGDFAPGWGLHLADVTLAYGDLVELARTQIAAFTR